MRRTRQKNIAVKPSNHQNGGVVRIIGGKMRGRKLYFTPIDGLRPTLDRTRETLFNWLARDISNSYCLDLFSGSGALGFEAASRGARQVTMVECSANVARDLNSNCQLLKSSNIEILNLEAVRFLASNENKFDIVFLDPPFGKGLLSDIFDRLTPHLNPEALVYVEQEKSASPFLPGENWQQVKFKKTASFSYALYRITCN